MRTIAVELRCAYGPTDSAPNVWPTSNNPTSRVRQRGRTRRIPTRVVLGSAGRYHPLPRGWSKVGMSFVFAVPEMVRNRFRFGQPRAAPKARLPRRRLIPTTAIIALRADEVSAPSSCSVRTATLKRSAPRHRRFMTGSRSAPQRAGMSTPRPPTPRWWTPRHRRASVGSGGRTARRFWLHRNPATALTTCKAGLRPLHRTPLSGLCFPACTRPGKASAVDRHPQPDLHPATGRRRRRLSSHRDHAASRGRQ